MHTSCFFEKSKYFIGTAFFYGLDQASKYWILSQLEFWEVRTVNAYFNLVLVGNPGAAFSFLAEAGGWQRWFFVSISVLAAAVIIFLLWFRHLKSPVRWALSFVLAGALGNLSDRLRYGYVIDFLDFHWASWHWPAFNIADSCITLALCYLIYREIKGKHPQSS